MGEIRADKKTLRKFGITIGLVFGVIALFIFIRKTHNTLPIAIISASFLIMGLFVPASLKGVYILWMRLALVLSWINTRLILLAMFYLVFFPVGSIIRILRIDLLDRKIEKGKQTYWLKKEKTEFKPSDYERQF